MMNSNNKLFPLALISFMAISVAACSGAKPHSGKAEGKALSHGDVSTDTSATSRAEVEASGLFLTPMPKGLTSFGAASHQGKIYVLGGYFGEPHRYSKEGQSKELWMLDTRAEKGEWEKLGELDHGRQSVMLVADGDALYAIGGMEARNVQGEKADLHSLAAFSRFDLKTNQWTEMPAMPKSRSSHEALIIGRKIFVAGGWRIAGHPPGEWCETVLSFDLDNPDAGWHEDAQPFHARAFAMAEMSGELVLIGGIGEHGVRKNVNIFNPDNDTWREGPTYEGDAFGASAFSKNGEVFISTRLGKMHRLSNRDDSLTWSEVAETMSPLFFHRSVIVDQKPVVLGGIAGMGAHARTRLVRTLPTRLFERTSKLNVSMLSFAYPGKAKNRQALAAHNGSLFLFGGNDSLEQHDFSPERFQREAWHMDLASFHFRAVDSLPVARQSMSVLVENESILVVGGFANNGNGSRSFGDAYRFDLKTGAWSEAGQLDMPRTQLGVASYQGDTWLFGGLDYDETREKDDHFRHLSAVANFPEGVSAKGGDMPEPRRAFGGAELDGHFYVVGGLREDFKFIEEARAFDFESKKWRTIANPPEVRISAFLVPMQGKLYLLGGSFKADGKMMSARHVDVYDPRSDTWSRVLDALPVDTKHMQFLAYRGRILGVSTHNNDAKMNLIVIE